MPEKIILNFTRRLRSDRRLFQVAVCFSMDWDEFYYDHYDTEKQKKEAHENLFSDIGLAFALEAEQRRYLLSPVSKQSGPVWYIDRVAIVRPSNDYQLLCCHERQVFLKRISLTQITAAKAEPNTVWGFLRKDGFYDDDLWDDANHRSNFASLSESQRLEQKYQNFISNEVQAELHQQRVGFKNTVNIDESVAFITMADKKRAKRIMSPIKYPNHKEQVMNFSKVYEAALPVPYRLFQACYQHLEVLLGMLARAEAEFQQMTWHVSLASPWKQLQRFKTSLVEAQKQAKQIIEALNAIADKKAKANEEARLLKKRYIWVVQESAREYYLHLWSQSLNNPQVALQKFNDKFLFCAEVNSLYRLKFKRIHDYTAEWLFTAFFGPLKYKLWHPYLYASKAYAFIKENLSIVYHDYSLRFQEFDFSSGGMVIIEDQYQAILQQANPAVIEPYYSKEMQTINRQMAEFNELFDLTALSQKKLDDALVLLERKLNRMESYCLTFTNLAVNYTDLASGKAEVDFDDRKQSSSSSSSELLDEAQDNLCQVMLMIDEILDQPQWWQQQVRGGCCAGETDADIRMPAGIKSMRLIKAQKNADDPPEQTLQAYQAIVKERFNYKHWAYFFAVRVCHATQRFYELIQQLNSHAVTKSDCAKFANFLQKITQPFEVTRLEY